MSYTVTGSTLEQIQAAAAAELLALHPSVGAHTVEMRVSPFIRSGDGRIQLWEADVEVHID